MKKRRKEERNRSFRLLVENKLVVSLSTLTRIVSRFEGKVLIVGHGGLGKTRLLDTVEGTDLDEFGYKKDGKWLVNTELLEEKWESLSLCVGISDNIEQVANFPWDYKVVLLLNGGFSTFRQIMRLRAESYSANESSDTFIEHWQTLANMTVSELRSYQFYGALHLAREIKADGFALTSLPMGVKIDEPWHVLPLKSELL